ncbi:DUF6101 family protein [Methylocapsa sp. S129]|uniref:DUF6101 family protein n=1 Tax=Methylocapsa sp. S129 TaxID=1641869 RepID=UPI00131E2169|nr:DUF6101 family protein [Methylocapsa sp. S129]
MQAERSQALPGIAAAPKPGVAEPRRIEVSDPRADGRRRVVLLARDRVVIARSVAGVFMHIAMAPNAYRGVVLRMSALRDGIFHYEIRLAHRDPDLSITLHEASDDSEIRAEWRLWARFLGLPTLIEREEGRAEPEGAHLGEIAIARTKARRRGAAMSRRPRFLTRRKTGRPDPSRRLTPGAREIFPGSKEDR